MKFNNVAVLLPLIRRRTKMSDKDVEREVKRKRQQKRMTKILAKAWNLPDANYFQDLPTPTDNKSDCPHDLSTMGQKLDGGAYSHGKSGWENFSRDLGGIYNRIINRYDK